MLQITLDYISTLMAGRDIMLPAPAAAARPAGGGASCTVQQQCGKHSKSFMSLPSPAQALVSVMQGLAAVLRIPNW